eukprot:gnl/TRDRNA2_/TRDRNA2_90763_c0_seq1.p1 gnl/TRDRNA2_/TRDRNA2_90763_c0~~gnl/TRDRNA2_/TRDRNA2_90763_c0_seq1.p1  ORF type:complete len:264 (+),score=34.22 gnl/TRDRNA2_/TRDRNA2_90763_c0_seq1:64-855(+)
MSATSAGGGRLLAAANFAQVVGFKVGHLYSGAPLWQIHRRYGWGPEMWVFLALPIMVVAALAAATPEPKPVQQASGLQNVMQDMKALLSEKRTCRLMVLASSYKAGEKVLMSMFKPALVDAGHAAADVGAWVGTYGAVGSMLGSTVATAFMPRCSSTADALRSCMIFRTGLFAFSLLPIPAQLALAAQGVGSGLITPVMFAFLMEAVSGSTCAVTHYTVLQCCDDLSRTAGQTVAGSIATHIGFRATFALAIAASILPLTLRP